MKMQHLFPSPGLEMLLVLGPCHISPGRRADWTWEDKVTPTLHRKGVLWPTDEGGLEEGLRAAEAFVPNGDHLAIRQLVALLKGGGGCGSGHLVFKVKSYVAQLLLDVPHNLTLRCSADTDTMAHTLKDCLPLKSYAES